MFYLLYRQGVSASYIPGPGGYATGNTWYVALTS
jgi:hypothetical protein